MAYVTRLTNGVAYSLAGISATSNSSYAQDPYFNFMLPSNATNLRVTLVDDSSQSYYNNLGLLIVQRGQQPSNNSIASGSPSASNPAIIYTDGRLATGNLGYGYQVPAAEHLFALTIPSNQVIAGEWFVSLDFNGAMLGGTLLVQWDHNATVVPTVTNLAMNTDSASANTNGVLTDGADFFFTLPALPLGDAHGVTYWTIEVQENYTLTVVLCDNATGDMQASITAGTKYYELGLSLGGNAFNGPPTHIGTLSPCPRGVAYQKAPFSTSYTSTVVGGETVYINVASSSNVPAEGLRMLVTCVSGKQNLPNSDYEPSSNAGAGMSLATATA